MKKHYVVVKTDFLEERVAELSQQAFDLLKQGGGFYVKTEVEVEPLNIPNTRKRSFDDMRDFLKGFGTGNVTEPAHDYDNLAEYVHDKIAGKKLSPIATEVIQHISDYLEGYVHGGE